MAEKKANSAFNDSARAVAPLPDGYSRGVEISLDKAIPVLFKHADHVHVGDSSHENTAIRSRVLSDDVIKAMAKSGASKFFLELPQDNQVCVDNLVKTKDMKGFIREMNENKF